MSGEVILYNADDGAQMQVRASEGTVWLTQAEMAELYGTSIPNVAQIIGRVLKDREVTEAPIHSELIVRREGERNVRRKLKGVDGWDYVDECVKWIRDIHAQEKRFYQTARDPYTTAIDNDPSSPAAKALSATVHNTMLSAVTGHTAAEIIPLRSDPTALAEERYDAFDAERRHQQAIAADEDDARILRELEQKTENRE